MRLACKQLRSIISEATDDDGPMTVGKLLAILKNEDESTLIFIDSEVVLASDVKVIGSMGGYTDGVFFDDYDGPAVVIYPRS